MDENRIDELATELSVALLDEYKAAEKAADEKAGVEMTEAQVAWFAQQDGKIDGKNKDTRDVQRAAIIADDEDCGEARASLMLAQQDAKLAEIARRRIEAVISMTKALLYSQCGH